MLYTPAMQTALIILIVIAAVILVGFIFPLIFCYLVACRVYQVTLVRTDKDKWGRHCSEESNPEQLAMWNAGLSWQEGVKDHSREVRIENDGFKLYGEYYDFGSNKAVIIIPGRTESLMYSYYFASPYERAGFNVLVIDIRSHGNSDGKYDYLGIGEDMDIIRWSQLLHEQFGNESVILHGICMGANTAIHALTHRDCPSYISGFVSEGCYISFYECYKRHMEVDKHPTFPVLPMVMHLIKVHTGTDVNKTRPIDFISRVTVPTLFLCGKKDVYSLPEKSQLLFDKLGSSEKELVWFEEGSHSHLRIAGEELYDNAIISFMNKHFR